MKKRRKIIMCTQINSQSTNTSITFGILVKFGFVTQVKIIFNIDFLMIYDYLKWLRNFSWVVAVGAKGDLMVLGAV